MSKVIRFVCGAVFSWIFFLGIGTQSAQAAGLTSTQLHAIMSFLSSFGADPSIINKVNNLNLLSNVQTAVQSTSTVDSNSPSVPAKITGDALSTNEIDVYWLSSTDPVVAGQTTSGLKGYNVYRNGSLLSFSASNFYRDTTVMPSNTYSYSVSSVDNANNESSRSALVSITTPLGDSSIVSLAATLPTTNDLSVTKGGTGFGTVISKSVQRPCGNYGDVNIDGKIDIVDALFISQNTVGLRVFNGEQLIRADVNRDGGVNIVDAMMISQYTTGLRPILPACQNPPPPTSDYSINCGTACTAPYPPGINVVLSATPEVNSAFTAWSSTTGVVCPGTGMCTVPMTDAEGVNAVFTLQIAPPSTYALTVVSINGSGSVVSVPAGISCSSTGGTGCTTSYSSDTSVTLSATPQAGYSFSGWGGDCSGTGSCVLSMTQAHTNITATFAIIPVPSYTLTVSKAGAGVGTVTSSDTSINCGTTCSASYVSDTSVTLTATPQVNSTFTGWSGGCTGTASTCGVSMTSAKSVTATFAAIVTSSKFIVGDRVAVFGTGIAGLTVRSGAGTAYSSIGIEPEGALGTVSGGPINANGYWWWSIDYANGVSGWSVENYLIKQTASASHYKNFGSSGDDRGLSVAIDRDENTYLAGSFSRTTDFGGGALTSRFIPSLPGDPTDGILAKYSPTGVLIWANQMGGYGSDRTEGITADPSGDIVTVGSSGPSVDLDSTNGNGPVELRDYFQGFGGYDVFVAKYSGVTGVYLWGRPFGGVNNEFGHAVGVGTNGEVAITGDFNDAVNFSCGLALTNGQLNEINCTQPPLSSLGSKDIFVAKLASNGNYLWSKRFGSTGDDIGKGVVMDSNGDIYVTGTFIGSVDFGPYTLTNSSLTSTDIFLVKLSGVDGHTLWAKSLGTTSMDSGNSLSLDALNNIVLSGSIVGVVDFGGVSLTSRKIGATFLADAFVAKYTASGNLEWARRMGGTGADASLGVSTNLSGDVAMTGNFLNAMDFDGTTTTLTSAGSNDAFAVTYSSSGAFRSARRIGGTGDDRGNAVALNAGGKLIATGYFTGIVDLDNDPVTNNSVTSVGGNDIFLVSPAL